MISGPTAPAWTKDGLSCAFAATPPRGPGEPHTEPCSRQPASPLCLPVPPRCSPAHARLPPGAPRAQGPVETAPALTGMYGEHDGALDVQDLLLGEKQMLLVPFKAKGKPFPRVEKHHEVNSPQGGSGTQIVRFSEAFLIVQNQNHFYYISVFTSTQGSNS
ncbi:unnamed protein product [Boreogadus saida]